MYSPHLIVSFLVLCHFVHALTRIVYFHFNSVSLLFFFVHIAALLCDGRWLVTKLFVVFFIVTYTCNIAFQIQYFRVQAVQVRYVTLLFAIQYILADDNDNARKSSQEASCGENS